MAKEDYLFRQFDLFARVIGKVIADFLGKTNNEEVLEIDRIKSIVQSELDLDLDELFQLENEEELTTLLLENKKISFESLEKLVELFIEIGDKYSFQNTKNQALIYYRKALQILEIISKNDTVYSLTRMNLIEGLKLKLE
jgi:hypothetical protein